MLLQIAFAMVLQMPIAPPELAAQSAPLDAAQLPYRREFRRCWQATFQPIVDSVRAATAAEVEPEMIRHRVAGGNFAYDTTLLAATLATFFSLGIYVQAVASRSLRRRGVGLGADFRALVQTVSTLAVLLLIGCDDPVARDQGEQGCASAVSLATTGARAQGRDEGRALAISNADRRAAAGHVLAIYELPAFVAAGIGVALGILIQWVALRSLARHMDMTSLERVAGLCPGAHDRPAFALLARSIDRVEKRQMASARRFQAASRGVVEDFLDRRA